MSRKATLLLLFLWFALTICKADMWSEPKKKTFFSDNMKYKLIVTPTFFPEKYYAWEYKKRIIASHQKVSARKVERFNKSFTAKDTVKIPCHAKLYYLSDTDTTLIWERDLLNMISPLRAIVSNDGSSIVTFDNWFSCGYGETVMVVYDEKGDARKSYELSDISPYSINEYFQSISSIWWFGGAYYIDNNRVEIEFYAQNKSSVKRIYHTKLYEFEKITYPEF